MFRPDFWSLLVILVIVLLIFGPKNLPRLGGMLGKMFRDFKNAKDQLPSKDDLEIPQKRAEATPVREEESEDRD